MPLRGSSLNVLTAAALAYLVTASLYLLSRLTPGERPWGLALLDTFAPYLFLPLVLVIPFALLCKHRLLLGLSGTHLLVALIWFLPFFFPTAAADESGLSIQVVTFNTQLQVHGLEPWLRALDADVVLLQEVTEAHLDLAIRLRDRYPYRADQPSVWGNMVLSRHPIRSAEDLVAYGHSVPQRLVLDIAGREVVVYNVHLAWPIGPSRIAGVPTFHLQALLGYDERPRNAQLRRLLEDLRQETRPFIVAGDFNLSEHSLIYREVAEAMHDAFRHAGSGWGNSWPAERVAGLALPPLIRIDYIWHSSQLQSLRAQVGPRLGSDHLPVIATLALSKEAEF